MIVIETKINPKIENKKSNFGEYFFVILIYLFAGVGALFVGVFFANRLKLTNTAGSVDVFSNSFKQINSSHVLAANTESTNSGIVENELSKIEDKREYLINYLCNINFLEPEAPLNTLKIIEAKGFNVSLENINKMVFIVKTHLPDQENIESKISDCQNNFKDSKISEQEIKNKAVMGAGKNILVWPNNPEWKIIKEAIAKDQDLINEVASLTKIDPRLIISNLVVEQLRLYNSQRELYKKFFEPLKILANANKFSLGVMSIKEETALQIEKHLKDSSSPFYLGSENENILSYTTTPESGNERYNRLTSSNHYYNYLYGAIYLKQFLIQWQQAGFDISNRPEILGTLFNLGFNQSNPNIDASVGGSSISIGSTTYSFGRLAGEFYYSGEMLDVFPYPKK